MPVALYYTVFICVGNYPNMQSTQVLGTYNCAEAYRKVNELKAKGYQVAINHK